MSEPRHTYRYPRDRYERAKARAQAEGTTVTEVIAARLDEYVDQWLDKMRAEAELDPIVAMVEADTTYRVEGVTDPVITKVEPACTALVGPKSKPCPCAGFQNQKISPNRCGQCGHLKGLHQ
jgi:hypothetical protein